MNQGWLLNVGFAFDVNAGRKSDAPKSMQSVGLTLTFRGQMLGAGYYFNASYSQ